jgi:DNA-binding transcriptional LysR family regulator
MHNWDWSDLRYVLAVAREGSAAAAARALDVNHSTVVRRVRAFEDKAGVRIFDHLSTGYRLTDEGKDFLAAAESIDGVLHELGRSIVRSDDDLAGHVRITTTDSIAPLLVDKLAELSRVYPEVTTELQITNSRLNLEALDADLAIRPTLNPPGRLVGRKICDLGFGLYVSSGMLAAAGQPAADTLPTLGLGGALASSSLGQWLDESPMTGPTVMRCDSFMVLLALAEEGAGCAILPCWLGEGSPRLRRVGPNLLEFRNHLWLLHHSDVRRSRRVRVVGDGLVTALRAKRALIEGPASIGQSGREACPSTRGAGSG